MAPDVPDASGARTPIRMLHDRVLVTLDTADGERRSAGGILIPVTAEMGGKRLVWARVVAIGSLVRAVESGDRVLFEPEEKAEIEVHGETHIVVRERDLHAVASDRLGDANTGLYL